MVWRDPKDHSLDCELCLTNITGITSKSKHTVQYPYMPPAMRPVPHSEKLPVPKPLEYMTFSDDNSDAKEDQRQQEGNNVDCDLKFEASCSSSEPHFLTQEDLNDPVRDFNLSKITS
jgi:hypothetical protein